MSATLPHGWIVPRWPAPARVRALATTRAGGVSRARYASLNLATRVGDDPNAVERNRARLRSVLPAEPLWLDQVHGVDVVDAEMTAPRARADAVVSRTPRAVCAVLTADCLPVLLADRDGEVVGVAHAGWRGLARGIVEATLARIGLPGHRLVAWLGPAISQSAYEVGEDVYCAFVAHDSGMDGAFRAAGPGKFRADLYALARRRLQGAGVTDIHGGGYCTHGEAERFFSCRRDGVTGRMAALIWIE